MKIIIREIPKQGLQLHFASDRDPWFQSCLKDSLADLHQPGTPGLADITLLRTGANVDCDGEIACDCFPTCSRCLKVFRCHLEIPFHLILAPLYESEQELKRLEKEEVELVKEDLGFTYYEGDRFSLSNIIREQVILSVPMQPLCQARCKGLCSQCGQNLNEGTCRCKPKSAQTRLASLIKK